MDDKVKELLDRVRNTAVGAADAANQTARIAGTKAGQMVDVAKLNVQLFDLNGEFSEVLRQLGQVMYDAHRGQEADGEITAALLERADELSGRVEELKAVGLTVPETTELLWELRKAGLDVPLDALSDEECAAVLAKLLTKDVTPA